MGKDGASSEEASLCVVIVGDSLVGKTSFLHRICDETGSASDVPPVTVGTNFFDLRFLIDGASVRLELWDTAGQERFRSIVPMYYRRADIVLVFFDVTNRASFLHAREWVSEARRFGHRISLVMLIANKIDLCSGKQRTGSSSTSASCQQRASSGEEVKQFIATFDLLYAEMSVRQNINVKSALETAVRETLNMRSERQKLRKAASVVKIESQSRSGNGCCRSN